MKFKLKIVDNFNPNPTLVCWVYKHVIILISILLVACSGTRHLPKGEKLYTGAEIRLVRTDNTKVKINKGLIKTIAKESFRPIPNGSFLGMRPKLSLYMYAGENPKSKFKKWLKKIGEAPVLMSAVKPRVTTAVIDSKLFNIGIFNSLTESNIVEKKRTSSIIYTSYIHQRFTIKEIIQSISQDSLSHAIQIANNMSLIHVGDEYSLDLLKVERIRIDAILKNRGYFYFNPDYLLFKADTSSVNRTVSLKLTLKENIPENALTVYRINHIFINQNFSLSEEPKDSTIDTIVVRRAVFLGKAEEQSITPKVIMRSVFLRKNQIYSRENHNITLNRLMSMGNFKFVQVKLTESDTAATGLLDVTILMTPLPKHTLRAELDIISKTNNYTGPQLNLSVLNRNTFKGAEQLNLTMAGSFEAQLGQNNTNYSYSLNPQAELTFPRFLVPFSIKSRSRYNPKTRFLLSYNYMKRVEYFDMNTFQLIYGFKWKASTRVEQEFNPVNISYTTVRNKTALFQRLLDTIPYLKKSYEEQFIAGASYAFTYNEMLLPAKKIQYYLQFNAETAGNLFSAAKLLNGEHANSTNPSKMVGAIYSQYAKLSLEGRAYYNFEDMNKIAMRVYAGVANPYGNSAVMPYSKQFFSGGPNSVRAFQINSLGPGINQQNDSTRAILQLGGDIKLEMNAEYRFGIYRFLKGALFVDAGNVWLQKSNPSKIGTPFLFSTFMNEMAVGAGVGLRLDVSFFILRFDVAMPLRKPWLPDNQRWVINQIDFGNPSWRTRNLVLNIAIGYPF